MQMEKTTGNTCPHCRENSMDIYFADDSDDRIGAFCQNCKRKYFYEEEKPVLMQR